MVEKVFLDLEREGLGKPTGAVSDRRGKRFYAEEVPSASLNKHWMSRRLPTVYYFSSLSVLSLLFQAHLDKLRADIGAFKAENKLDKVIVMWTANTEVSHHTFIGPRTEWLWINEGSEWRQRMNEKQSISQAGTHAACVRPWTEQLSTHGNMTLHDSDTFLGLRVTWTDCLRISFPSFISLKNMPQVFSLNIVFDSLAGRCARSAVERIPSCSFPSIFCSCYLEPLCLLLTLLPLRLSFFYHLFICS